MDRRVKPEEWQPAGGLTLEDAARHVVMSDASRSVIAGPGSGKTELLAQRAVFLLETGACPAPQRILAISFKRDAAKNLKDRVARRCPSEQARRFDSYTFDAFAKTIADRFLALAPDWCRPPRGYRVLLARDLSADWRDFQRSLADRYPDFQHAVMQVAFEDADRWGPLPAEPGNAASATEWVAREWWARLLGAQTPGLTFPMIGRLAEAILRYNPLVLRALQKTYSHVFLDEFQDTTAFQFGLTRLCFEGSGAVMTAVGDTQQRIMTWAGAIAEVFDDFETVFGAERQRLLYNHRSNRRIVALINDLLHQIEADLGGKPVETICARKDDPVPEDAASFFVFETDEDEAGWLADYISSELESGSLSGDDFALLVRVNAPKAENRLRPVFEQRGLRLRNEARVLEELAIQDLMADDLAALLIGIMRLASGVRGREVYEPVLQSLGAILGTDYENETSIKRLEDRLGALTRMVKTAAEIAPGEADMNSLVGALVEELGAGAIRQAYRQYENDRFFANVQASLAMLMSECAEAAETWENLLEAVEGVGQVRLMTVHKSKGLEYHTAIIVGLHQRQFFGYRNNAEEETNTFFVALSRARERVIFTRSLEGGGVRQIQGLIDLLQKAGVEAEEVGGG